MQNKSLPEKFHSQLGELGLTLTKRQEEQLLFYYETLIETNRQFNLTAVTEYQEVLEKHFLDSLSVVPHLPETVVTDLKAGGRLMDMGSGAGLPGIPLAIVFPEAEVCLVDSLGKRVRFLNETVQGLGLHKAVALHSRAEDLGHDKKHREQYTLCVSRAVAALSPLAEYCLPLVKKQGYFIPYKGKLSEEERGAGEQAIKLLGGSLVEEVSFRLPQTEYERCFLLIKKTKETPGKYPRKAGTPTRDSLGA